MLQFMGAVKARANNNYAKDKTFLYIGMVNIVSA